MTHPTLWTPTRSGHWLGAGLLMALLAGNVGLALGPWAVREADSGPVSAAFWRLFLALPVLILLNMIFYSSQKTIRLR